MGPAEGGGGGERGQGRLSGGKNGTGLVVSE